jgi:hypothetical protein
MLFSSQKVGFYLIVADNVKISTYKQLYLSLFLVSCMAPQFDEPYKEQFSLERTLF